MDKILHYFKDPKLWELWHIPYNGSCRILSINSMKRALNGGVPTCGPKHCNFSKSLNPKLHPKPLVGSLILNRKPLNR